MSRIERVNELMREAIATILSTKITDPRIGFVTVTKVETTPDLRHARVFLSILGDRKQRAKTMEALEHAKGFVRNEMAKVVRLKYLPELAFQTDESLESSYRIGSILKRLEKESSSHKAEDDNPE